MNLRVRGDEGVAGAIGNVGQLAGNPLMDPRFKIPGGQPWNKTPLLPGKDKKDVEDVYGRPGHETDARFFSFVRR
jgi:hypothetical protein